MRRAASTQCLCHSSSLRSQSYGEASGVQQNGDRSQEDDIVLDEVTVKVRSCHENVLLVFLHVWRAGLVTCTVFTGHPSVTQRNAESKRLSCNDSQDTQQLEFPDTTPSN